MRLIALLVFFISTSSLAHELQSVTQYIDIKGQNETGLQQDIIGRFNLSRQFDFGLQGTYLERYEFYETRLGGLIGYRPTDRLSLELRYLQGNDNDILPENEGILSAYYALADGLSPYLIYRNTRYSLTHLHTGTLGMEIEKIRSFIFIPQVQFGKATFEAPNETKDVYNAGLRVIYYQEGKYSLTAFAYAGKEASQGIIGRSTILVDTMTGGLGGGYYFTPSLKADLILDHTDYDQLDTQFLTTTLNLVWKL